MKTHFSLLFVLIYVLLSCEGDRQENLCQNKLNIDKARLIFRKYIANDGDLAYNSNSSDSNNFLNFSNTRLLIPQSVINRDDALIFALEENYIDTSKLPNKKSWLRITVDPSFRFPYCIIVEKKNGLTYLTGKMTDGYGGYFPGYLDFCLTQTFPDTLYNWVSKRLHDVNFFEMTEEKDNIGDGDGWTIELIENNKYNLVKRRSPNHYGSNPTKELGRIGLKLKELSKILEVLPIVDTINNKKLMWQH